MTSQYPLWIRNVLNGLVNPVTNHVRFATLHETDTYLRQLGFVLGWTTPYGPHGGTMLFYWSAFGSTGEGIVVRIKTHGESVGKPRAFKPHMSVAWMEHGIDYQRAEKAKYSSAGVPLDKAPPRAAPPADVQSWADRTHFMFPGFDNSSESKPRGLQGAENLLEEAATHAVQ